MDVSRDIFGMKESQLNKNASVASSSQVAVNGATNENLQQKNNQLTNKSENQTSLNS
jgi:hypothetical protein